MIFRDRTDAGRRLAERLFAFRDRDPVVLALPRGGVPVGFEVAEALDAPLDVVLVRKIGVPFQPELALGAVSDGGAPDIVIDERLMAELAIPESYVREASERHLREIERRRKLYCGNRAPLEVPGRTAIIVDDGIATGATMRVALRAVRRRGPRATVLAVPVAPPETIDELRPEVDEIICLSTPLDFMAVGAFYADFAQVSDEIVASFLERRASQEETRLPS